MASPSRGVMGGGKYIKPLIVAIIKILDIFAYFFLLQHIYGVNKVKVMKFKLSNPNRINFYHDLKDTAVIEITDIIL